MTARAMRIAAPSRARAGSRPAVAQHDVTGADQRQPDRSGHGSFAPPSNRGPSGWPVSTRLRMTQTALMPSAAAGEGDESSGHLGAVDISPHRRHHHHRAGDHQPNARVASQEAETGEQSADCGASVRERTARKARPASPARSLRTVLRSTPPRPCARGPGWRRAPSAPARATIGRTRR